MSKKPTRKGDDGKAKKQQAASLARRMAGKKGQTTQLQVEVNNEEEWEKLLTREGVIVIDVYSDWSGPCVGMIGNLKKAKVDLGGDSLHLATAKNDEIEVLSRFRNRSEPTWLFAAGGQLVNGMFGANAPKLMKMIEFEVRREARILNRETWRQGAPFTELFEEERHRLTQAEKLKSEEERREAEKKARQIEEKRMKIYSFMAENLLYETVIACFPHTIQPDGCVLSMELEMFLRSQMMYISQQAKMVITREIFDEIFFRGSIEPTDDLFEDLRSGPCLVMLIKCQIIGSPGQEGEKKKGELERIIAEALYQTEIEYNQEVVVPDASSLPARFPYIKKKKGELNEEEEEVEIIEEVTSVPGCWTPSTFITKCAAVRYLFPTRAEKVMAPEEPQVSPKVVIAFDISKHKECFDLIDEFQHDVLNVGYFSGTDPYTAEHLCATPDQYAKLPHVDTNKLVVVLKRSKSEPLLSFAGMGATYVSHDDKGGGIEADLFFPPGVEPKFYRLEEAERALQAATTDELQSEEEQEKEEEEEEHDEDDLMALLGVKAE